MEISQTELARLLLYCFVLGIVLGGVYELLRSLRNILFGGAETCRFKKACAIRVPFSRRRLVGPKRRTRAESVMSNAADLLCAILAGVGIIVLCYAYNSGRIRAFCVIGVLSGYALARLLLGRVLTPAAEALLLAVKYLFSSIVAVICIPIKKIYKIMHKFLKKITSLFILTLEKKRKRLYNIKEEVYAREGERNDNALRFRISVEGKQKKEGRADGGKE